MQNRLDRVASKNLVISAMGRVNKMRQLLTAEIPAPIDMEFDVGDNFGAVIHRAAKMQNNCLCMKNNARNFAGRI